MKKILLGSIAFLLFAISISLLQSSCGKDANASPESPNTTTQLNKILFCTGTGENGAEIWVATYDGSNQTKININLPSPYKINADACLSPDGKRVFVSGYIPDRGVKDWAIFSCELSGNNIVKVVDDASILGAY